MGIRVVEIPDGVAIAELYKAECDNCQRVFDIGDHHSWPTTEEAITAAVEFDWQHFDNDETILCADCTATRVASG